jgi:pimeloyl-ACP methyl ester carboxylesterase
MARHPLVLIHGYSDQGESFHAWENALEARGYDVTTIHTCTYRTLTNEVTIKDIAEGFDRALRIRTGLNAEEPFDAIVHSTGMLVIRAWLTNYGNGGRRRRLKRLIGLAPATFGSPLAHKGRSWLGSIFKGNRETGPDFLESGDRVLDGLELGSRFTWDLAHLDLIGAEPFYGPDSSTPYVFILCGTQSYGGLRRLVNEPGTDGTVRWAGCPLNTRKVVLDLTRDPTRPEAHNRIMVADWTNINMPLILVAGMNHGTILSAPTPELIEMVHAALQVENEADFNAWNTSALARTRTARQAVEQWQQFVMHATDERGDPIRDFYIELFTRDERGRPQELEGLEMDVHAYSADPSFRCFHVNLSALQQQALANLWMRAIASSGSQLVGYHGFCSEKAN